jgi:hypothetical protein
MTDQSASPVTEPGRHVAAPLNPAEVTLNWMLGLFLIGGVMAIIAGVTMDAPNEFTPNEINTAGVPLIMWGGGALSMSVMAFFSLLIVNAVRWKAPTSGA